MGGMGGMGASMPIADVVALCNLAQSHSVLPGRAEIYNQTKGLHEVVLQFPDRTETYNQLQVHPEVALEPPDGTKTNYLPHEHCGVAL